MGDLNCVHHPSVYILARHPLALQFIGLFLDARRYDIKSFTNPPDQETCETGGMLVIDTHSVEDWPIVTSQCMLYGRRVIILVNEPPRTLDEEVRLVYIGIRGIVSAENAANDLAKAVDVVSQGGLWISLSAMAEYANRSNARSIHLRNDHFTGREEQIFFFLSRGFSNKEIGKTLRISERTVKFHVSNVLQKLNLESRRDLAG